MPECPYCKASCEPQDRYCSQCGVRLAEEAFMESGARTQKSLDLVDVHYNLGLVYFKKGRYQEALETWEKGLARDPGNKALQERITEVRKMMGSTP